MITRFISILLIFISSVITFSQSTKPIVQFNGIVIEGDSLYGVSGAYVFVPNTSRGTKTNEIGYFSFPALPGDSVIVTKWGYKKQLYVMPKVDSILTYKVVFELEKDTLTLPEIELTAFPSEKKFKEVFLAMNVPMTDYNNATTNLNTQILQRLFVTEQISPGEAYKHYINERATTLQNTYGPQPLTLLSPFAWAKFFKDLKEFKEKKKK